MSHMERDIGDAILERAVRERREAIEERDAMLEAVRFEKQKVADMVAQRDAARALAHELFVALDEHDKWGCTHSMFSHDADLLSKYREMAAKWEASRE